MGVLDSALQQVATILIGALSDVPATYTRTPAPRYDGRTGQELNFQPVSYSVKITPPQPYTKREVNGTTTAATDLRCYISAVDLPITPDIRTDSLTWQGTTFNLVRAAPVPTADASILIELILRA